VLLIEDRAVDADLILNALRQSGFDPDCRRVATERDYLASLTSDHDIIVADFASPGLDVRRAQALARERGLETPLIVVSRTIGEEHAVAAMQTGACDYLLKDRLERLGPAVRRALEGSAVRQRRARSALAERGSDALNAAILKTVSDGIIVVDDASTITEFNTAAQRMFGRTRTDAIGRPIGDLLRTPGFADDAEPPFAAAARAGHPREMIGRHADGRRFPVDLALSRISADGVAQFAGVVRDISERKANEAAVIERNRLSAFARDIGIAFTESVSLAAMLDLCAQLIAAHLGVALAQIWTPRHQEDRLQLLASAGQTTAAAGSDVSVPGMFFKLDDFVRARVTVVASNLADDPRADHEWAAANGIVSFVGYPLIVGDRLVGVITMFGRTPFSDGTVQAVSYIANAVASAIERDRSEAAQARLAAIVEATTDLVSIRMLDHSGPAYLNLAGRTMLGLTASEPVPDLAAFRTEESLTEWTDLILPAALKDGLWAGETSYVNRGGREIPVSQLLLAHATPDGKTQLSIIARDITDRRRSADELRSSDERMGFALEAACMGVWEFDVRTGDVTWTEMGAVDRGRRPGRFAGSAEEFFAATHVDDRDALRQAFERAITERQDLAVLFRTLGPGGEPRWIEFRGRVLYETEITAARIVGVSTDVTERKLLEAQLRQAQKMEAIGQLAGGVAHDFNNILTAILGYAKFAADSLTPSDQCRSDMEEVIKAAHRAAALTRQLLAFGRTQVLQPSLVDLNTLVTGVSEMFRRLIGEHIALEIALASDLALVRADAGQLEQVVMNLVVNARDALEQGGRLTITTANVQLRASSGIAPHAVPPGWYVKLSVADDGLGMDEKTKRHLFEPFFTTKERGKGTGIGLATVYGIVKQSDGYIWVDSEPGRGSTFTVYLPRTDSHSEAAVPAAVPVSRHGGSETLLLVEDEGGVRELARRMLERAGYRVLDAANGQDAELVFARHRGSIDLLVSDVVMPGMSGPELFRRLEVQRPGLKVVYISGYATEALARQLKLDRGQPHVQKPFTADQLASYVRGVLDGRPPESKGLA
jgi:PAS domain S-box-containing protein